MGYEIWDITRMGKEKGREGLGKETEMRWRVTLLLIHE